MRTADLARIRDWLAEPHVARWYLSESTLEDELDDLRRSVDGEQATHAIVVCEEGTAIGWCQWYLCREYPEHAAALEAGTDDVGIDYAIGDPARAGRGVGTALIAALVEHVREIHPGAAILADPVAANTASRRVLEHNGFALVGERALSSERSNEMMAIYRLPN
jgi:aminoglycoside 6'-N-acetyltransferase